MCKLPPHIRILGVAGGKSSVGETDFSWTNTYGRTHMSFLCNVAAGQHTPKSILESSEPRNVILAAALTRTATVQLAVGTLRRTGKHWETQ